MFRLLTHSVRGHKYLVGGPTVHPLDGDAPVPTGVGYEWSTLAEVKAHVRTDYSDISSIHAVTVVDADGETVATGNRTGYNGTGKRFVWSEAK